MQIIHERCCGLDVHKKSVVACVLTPESKVIRTFGTMTRGLLELADWLVASDVNVVAMESTGVYWKPVYNILEGYPWQLLVVNARHIKQVPGKKTDVKDAEWIAQVVRCGLVNPSLIPSRDERELRELVRYRKSLVGDRAAEVNRIQKVLEGANIKLASVASDVMGVSGRAILHKMVEGSDDPRLMAALAKGRMKAKTQELEEALSGFLRDHQRMLLKAALEHVDFLDRQIAAISEEVEARLRPFHDRIELLCTIPGVGVRTAQIMMATFGLRLDSFPDHQHLASWAGLCPGQNESAGKRRASRSRKGNPLLKTALVDAAWATIRTRGTYLGAQYRRLAAKRGPKRAIIAVAHSILSSAYTMLKHGTPYQELGSAYFDKRDSRAALRRAVARINRLGYEVSLTEVRTGTDS